jgi:2-phosphoglycerate kinase
MAIEGVHLVPGLLPTELHGAIVSQCLIAIPDEHEHASHFYGRDADSDALRPFEKYLNALPAIRRIQAYLLARAGEAGVPVIENSNRERAIEAVIRLVLDSFERVRSIA